MDALDLLTHLLVAAGSRDAAIDVIASHSEQ